jgi:hypothetical protein
MKVLIPIFIYLISGTNAHGYLSQPNTDYVNPSTKTGPVGLINANVEYPGHKWNDSPMNNFNMYKQVVGNVSIKNMIDAKANGCSNVNLNTIINVDNLSTLKWQNDEYKEGFTPSHTGPCEAWIDNKMVMFDLNCANTYQGYPAEINIDYSICSGECLFEFYWIGLHEPNWQLYKACVKISRTKKNTNPCCCNGN